MGLVRWMPLLAASVIVGCGSKDDSGSGTEDTDAPATGTGTGSATGTGTGRATGTGTGSATGTGTGGGVGLKECLDPFTPCGGDVTGTWNVVAVCALDVTDLGCDDASWEVTADRSSGTITFDNKGTYDQAYNLDLDFLLTLPTSCLFGQGCDTLLQFAGDVLDACTEVSDNCECTGTLQDTLNDAGTWMMDGDVLVTDGVDRTAICIQGNDGESMDEDGTRVIWQR